MKPNRFKQVRAEGRTLEAALAFLQQHGCDFIQGFLFSRPVSAANIPELLTRGGLKVAAAS